MRAIFVLTVTGIVAYISAMWVPVVTVSNLHLDGNDLTVSYNQSLILPDAVDTNATQHAWLYQ